MDDFESQDVDWLHSHENHVRRASGIRFDVFVRSLGPSHCHHDRQSSVLDRIDRLERTGVIDTSRVTVWGDSVCVSECCLTNRSAGGIRDRIETFRRWARENDHVSIGFERREIDSSITGESFDVIDLPTMCLAVYVDSRLDGLFPVEVGGEGWTVDTYLDWFERTRGTTEAKAIADA